MLIYLIIFAVRLHIDQNKHDRTKPIRNLINMFLPLFWYFLPRFANIRVEERVKDNGENRLNFHTIIFSSKEKKTDPTRFSIKK